MSGSDFQEILRRWYLARLRKAAHEDLAGVNATPAALILADRSLVESLAASEAVPSQIPPIDDFGKFEKSLRKRAALLIFVVFIFQLLILFLGGHAWH
ncbi:MAG: hypothetical protein K2X27_03185 [Candidatus Obscuribacterales bacterium]|nr:hypothetical protein [Candidatus Obscuribacterales bacterium]